MPTQLAGTQVASVLVPFTDADQYAVVNQKYIKGGWHTVDTISDRDAITNQRRSDGMVCWVKDEQKAYQLVGGTNNANWQTLQLNTPMNVGNVVYKGTWDAYTNTPTLANGTSGDLGYYYVTSISGGQFGLSFDVGDWVINNGGTWEKVDNNANVFSVFGRLGNIVSEYGDYTAAQVVYIPSGGIASADNVSDAIDLLDGVLTNISGSMALKANISDLNNYTLLSTTSSISAGLNTRIDKLNVETMALSASLQTKISSTEKGAPNGVSTLDSNQKIMTSQIPDFLFGNVIYKGTWNASTNTPTLTTIDASANKGYYYINTSDGNQFGIDFGVGDWIISDGVQWDKVDNTDAVFSVFGRMGNVVAIDGDYTASQIINNPSGNVNSIFVQGAINELDSLITSVSGNLQLEIDLVNQTLLNPTTFESTFDNTQLNNGKLLIIHNLDSMYNEVLVISNINEIIIPDNVLFINSNTVEIDISSFIPIVGIWNIKVIKSGGGGSSSTSIITSGGFLSDITRIEVANISGYLQNEINNISEIATQVLTTTTTFQPDVAQYSLFNLTLGGDTTLNVPINMNNGDKIVIKINQSIGNVFGVTYNSQYRFAGSMSPPNPPSMSSIILHITKISNNFYVTYEGVFSE